MERTRTFVFIALLSFIIIKPCIIAARTGGDYYPGDTWRVSTPEAQRMDSGYLSDMLDFINSNNLDIHSVIIIRHGYVVLEAYKEPFCKDIVHTLQSTTKSVMSALTGIALREGYIISIDQKAVDFFPGQEIKNLDEKKHRITIRNLLTMSSGITWDKDWGNSDYLNSINWTQYYLDLPMKTGPGKSFNYDSGGVNLLTTIVNKACGMKISDFADKFLFKQIGITNYNWETDPQGVEIGGYGLSLTPIDMARFGYLYLKNGKWHGKQVIPAAWVEESVSNHIDTSGVPAKGNFIKKGYGYL